MPNDEYVVRPAGERDIASVPHLRDEWVRVVEQMQPALFVIDLDAVTCLDITALGATVAIKNR
jgi:anti-anti-sigma regulatory factor